MRVGDLYLAQSGAVRLVGERSSVVLIRVSNFENIVKNYGDVAIAAGELL